VLTSFKSPGRRDLLSAQKFCFKPSLEGYCNLFTDAARARTSEFIKNRWDPRGGLCDRIARDRNMVYRRTIQLRFRVFVNSLIIAFGFRRWLAVALGTPVGPYGFSRFSRAAEGRPVVSFILSTRMMPPDRRVAIPIYLMYRTIGLSDHQASG